jgi:DMSO/TMAO reductase YedYZ molybdopterin-dependent catalytic subunit
MQKATLSRILILFIVSLLLVSCAGEQETVEESGNYQVVLEVQGLESIRALKLSDLKDLPSVEGWGGTVSSAGVITPPQRLKGVPLESLVDLVGGLGPGMGVSVVAKDGYGMTMSYEQVTGGDFITYDPGTGDENQVEGPLQVIVAYERDGEPISSEDDGPLRLFVISPKNDNIVDGHWTVKWVSQIRLKPMSEEWSLILEGARTEVMDRNSFESCSAPDCHQASWTDESGDEWTGVPLYYLAGRIDDEVIHEERAYNDSLAKAGYALELFAADGYNVPITSSRIDFNREIFLASLVNGEPLEEESFPLRLVGEGLEKGEMVGQVVQIVLKPEDGVALPAGETETRSPAEGTEELILPEGAALMITGKVLNTLTLKLENLEKMGLVELEVEHPKKGMQRYRGVLLNDLLDLAGPDSGAWTLVMIASDGYAAEANLSEVLACGDCLIALDEDGELHMVMAGMESGLWVKGVNFLEVK